MSETCLFCQIISGEMSSEPAGRRDDVIAIHDKFPRAPVHVLVMPEKHISSIHELDDTGVLARCFELAREVAEQEGITDGYRVVTNVGTRGGQAIPHLHFHVIGGRQLGNIDDVSD